MYSRNLIYWLIILFIATAILALPFIYIDISVKSTGIVRPLAERTEIKTSVAAIIDSIYAKEGDTVQKGTILLSLRNQNLSLKTSINETELAQRNLFIHDLEVLSSQSAQLKQSLQDELQTGIYIQEYNHLLYQQAEYNAQYRKALDEVTAARSLAKDKVIAAKELLDKEIEFDRIKAISNSALRQQQALWHQELARYKMERSQYRNTTSQIEEENTLYTIKSPVTGVVQNFNNRYSGGTVQAGEVLAVISPESELIAECFVNTRDVGLLRTGQPARYQVDAFDYNYFGILTGHIQSIDNDYTLIDNKPVFKVRCALDSRQLYLKNGFKGKLKKDCRYRPGSS